MYEQVFTQHRPAEETAIETRCIAPEQVTTAKGWEV